MWSLLRQSYCRCIFIHMKNGREDLWHFRRGGNPYAAIDEEDSPESIDSLAVATERARSGRFSLRPTNGLRASLTSSPWLAPRRDLMQNPYAFEVDATRIVEKITATTFRRWARGMLRPYFTLLGSKAIPVACRNVLDRIASASPAVRERFLHLLSQYDISVEDAQFAFHRKLEADSLTARLEALEKKACEVD